MITPASERCLEFLERTEVVEHDTTERETELTNQYIRHIEHAIAVTPKGSYQDVFVIANPGKDETREYAKSLAWQQHLNNEGNELLDAYYGAEPYSPYFGSEEVFDALIRDPENSREESDKDIWSITFQHPTRKHFYVAKYTPVKGGKGFGYRISIHKQPMIYENTLQSIARGTRYQLK